MKIKMIDKRKRKKLLCKEAQKMVIPYIEGELCRKDLERFVSHVQQCPECWEELETYYIVYKGLMQLDHQEELPMNILEALNEDLEDSENYLRNIRFMEILSEIMQALTAVLVMFLAGMKLLGFLQM